MPLSPVYGHSPHALPSSAPAGHLLPHGEKALGLLFTDSRLRRLVILIQRLGVAAIQRITRQGRQQLPAEVKRLLHRAVGVALADELLLKRAAKVCKAGQQVRAKAQDSAPDKDRMPLLGAPSLAGQASTGSANAAG